MATPRVTWTHRPRDPWRPLARVSLSSLPTQLHGTADAADAPHVRTRAPRPVPDPAGPEIVGHPSFSTDLALRIQDALDRFGPTTRVQVEGEAFVLVDPQHASFFPAEASMVRRTVASLAAGPFPQPLQKAVTVSVFGTPK
jgi:hypothetical protein